MALEIFKGVKDIGGFSIWQEELKVRDIIEVDEFVAIDHSQNTIYFQIQNGPIKESGINGCQVDTLLHAARKIIQGFTEEWPNTYNKHAIRHITEAIECLEARTKDREERGVEGTSKK